MAKIAAESGERLAQLAVDGGPGHIAACRLAQGSGWTVSNVTCSCGPEDRAYEERHSGFAIAIVASGSFQYHSAAGRELMSPGSLLLGNAGQHFECRHEHGKGDRCISFGYEPDYFERLAADAGIRATMRHFRRHRVPPLRELSRLVARACAGLSGPAGASWEELGVQLAAQTTRLVEGLSSDPLATSPSVAARVTRVIRMIERDLEARLTLGSLAREAGLSPYHFLRTFQYLTGLTPHKYILRTRLREAAIRLRTECTKVLDIALDCGFGDVSNFNRAFRSEFGVSPRLYRRQSR